MFNLKAVENVQLGPESKFKFRCYPGIKCFTACCSNIDIMLTPYDVLRLKKRLGISSEEFIEKYTVMRVDEKSSHPYAYLKMNEGKERLCPFLKAVEGCTIYADRPVSCRYYPVGQGTMKRNDGAGKVWHDEFYFFVREEHCKGFEEDKEWTIGEWNDDQESSLYDSMNREWKLLLMRRDLPGAPPLDEKKQTQFFMASYDLDRFRRFVFESRFLDIFDVPAEEVEKMRADETELMKFAFKYIRYLMMMEQALKVKEGVLPKKEEGKKD